MINVRYEFAGRRKTTWTSRAAAQCLRGTWIVVGRTCKARAAAWRWAARVARLAAAAAAAAALWRCRAERDDDSLLPLPSSSRPPREEATPAYLCPVDCAMTIPTCPRRRRLSRSIKHRHLPAPPLTPATLTEMPPPMWVSGPSNSHSITNQSNSNSPFFHSIIS